MTIGELLGFVLITVSIIAMLAACVLAPALMAVTFSHKSDAWCDHSGMRLAILGCVIDSIILAIVYLLYALKDVVLW